MNDKSAALPDERRLPPDPQTAFFLATAYRRLGGSFSIGSNGSRYFGRPEPVLFRLNGQELPQLPDVRPHERFHCEKEWQGAIKMVEVLLSRLADVDSDLVFGALASVAVDDRKIIPSIDDPKRRRQ